MALVVEEQTHRTLLGSICKGRLTSGEKDRPVIIKIFTQAERRLESALRERLMYERLHDLGLCGHVTPFFFGSKIIDNHLWMVLEAGTNDLLTLMKRAPLRVRRGWCLDILEATAALHTQHIAHLDLSLENCVLFPDKVKLVDFGVASTFQHQAFFDVNVVGQKNEFDGKVFGKPCYIYPPIVHLGPYSMKKADEYSLGMILFILLSEGCALYRRPHPNDPGFAIYWKHRRIMPVIRTWGPETGVHTAEFQQCLPIIEALLDGFSSAQEAHERLLLIAKTN